MIDIKQFPNEVILACLCDVAFEQKFYLCPEFYEVKENDLYFNGDFYHMLKEITDPNFEKKYGAKIHNLNNTYQKEKANLIKTWESGEIDAQGLNGYAEELNAKDEKHRKHLHALKTIKNNLFCKLERVNLEKFFEGEPLIFYSEFRGFFVATKNHVTKFNNKGVSPEIITYYTPKFKEKFDKIFGKTKLAEKTESEKTK